MPLGGRATQLQRGKQIVMVGASSATLGYVLMVGLTTNYAELTMPYTAPSILSPISEAPMTKLSVGTLLVAAMATCFVLLRFFAALLVSPLEAFTSAESLNILFWALQAAMPLGLGAVLLRRRLFAYAALPLIAFALSLSVGPMA